MALPFVYLFVGLCFVICYPLSKILDWALGREITAVYRVESLLRGARRAIDAFRSQEGVGDVARVLVTLCRTSYCF